MKFSPKLEEFRLREGLYGSDPGDMFGMFIVRGPCGRELRVLASSGDSELEIHWEHVSVSLPSRNPNWEEMCYVKSLFWDDEEAVMQLHPAKSRWINNHPYCLHMWRPIKQEIPLPPDSTVGNRSLGTLTP